MYKKRQFKSKKSAFTIMELAIVIAVISILAAVTIPTFSAIIQKARISEKSQNADNINKILTVYSITDGEPRSMHDVVCKILENGFSIEDFIAKDDFNLVWIRNLNKVTVVDKDLNTFDGDKLPPDKSSVWQIVREIPEDETTSIYLTDDFDDTSVEVGVGVDLGNNKNVKNVTYVDNNTESKDTLIRTNADDVEIIVKNYTDKIDQYGIAGVLTVSTSERNNNNLLSVYGTLKELNIHSGNVIIKSNAVIGILRITADSKEDFSLIIENGAIIGEIISPFDEVKHPTNDDSTDNPGNDGSSGSGSNGGTTDGNVGGNDNISDGNTQGGENTSGGSTGTDNPDTDNPSGGTTGGDNTGNTTPEANTPEGGSSGDNNQGDSSDDSGSDSGNSSDNTQGGENTSGGNTGTDNPDPDNPNVDNPNEGTTGDDNTGTTTPEGNTPEGGGSSDNSQGGENTSGGNTGTDNPDTDNPSGGTTGDDNTGTTTPEGNTPEGGGSGDNNQGDSSDDSGSDSGNSGDNTQGGENTSSGSTGTDNPDTDNPNIDNPNEGTTGGDNTGNTNPEGNTPEGGSSGDNNQGDSSDDSGSDSGNSGDIGNEGENSGVNTPENIPSDEDDGEDNPPSQSEAFYDFEVFDTSKIDMDKVDGTVNTQVYLVDPSISNEDDKYMSMKKALRNGGYIVLLQDLTTENNYYTQPISIDSDIIIDLNGHKILTTNSSYNYKIKVNNGGHLKIINTGDQENGLIYSAYSGSHKCITVENGGEVTIYGGKISGEQSALCLNEGAKATIKGGSFTNLYQSSPIVLLGKAELYISGGEFFTGIEGKPMILVPQNKANGSTVVVSGVNFDGTIATEGTHYDLTVG